MQKAVVVAIALIWLVGCGTSTHVVVDCAREVVVGGVGYHPVQGPWRGIETLASPGLAARPGVCAEHAYHDGPFQISAIKGVPPAVAVSTDRRFAGVLWLHPGELVLLPRHPLHGANARSRVAIPRRGCRPRAAISGSVEGVADLGEALTLRLARRLLTVRVESRTRVGGPPRLATGARVRVKLVQCPDSNKPVARAIARL